MLISQDVTEELIERLKQDDIVSALVGQLQESYPELVAPLIHERDLYLAWSMKRSKAVNGTQRVVAVVGRGHLRGVVYALLHDDGKLRFSDLVSQRNTSAYKQKAKKDAAVRFVLESLLAAGLYVAWTSYTAVPGGAL